VKIKSTTKIQRKKFLPHSPKITAQLLDLTIGARVVLDLRRVVLRHASQNQMLKSIEGINTNIELPER
jgi:hypothetical protein